LSGPGGKGRVLSFCQEGKAEGKGKNWFTLFFAFFPPSSSKLEKEGKGPYKHSIFFRGDPFDQGRGEEEVKEKKAPGKNNLSQFAHGRHSGREKKGPKGGKGGNVAATIIGVH